MIKSRYYTNLAGMTPDYYAVRDFFVRLGYSEYIYARWDWMITHSYLDHSAINKIKLWEDACGIVGIVTFDTRLGTAYCLSLPEYAYLKKEMLLYAEQNLREGDEFSVVIADDDVDFQFIAHELAYVATPHAEHDAIMYLEHADLSYTLPEGYTIVSMADRYDPYEYRRVLWKGFNHEINGEGPLVFNDEERATVDFEMLRNNVDLSLKLAVVSPDGHFVSYCGMWYDPSLDFSLIEPLATDPDFRGKGLAQAVVLEGMKRVKALGAKTVLVGSNQPFYYAIGMFPYKVSTIWKKKRDNIRS
ncbi:MAG: hypothetical protein A2Y20_09955 [Firmicutes bacterium GWF2_51_9]|nr:MAG: hypothetical protein A2Y20_09955 [Firmicutes bacterium GWF2_51_9]OGS59337.1 MAG: hypothetical protein A2Y19_09070 [Firmicutes bacterium GWE2_51_13]HAM62379.1 hypothetical protein [Erysipelotrichaceae bacterium]HBZ40294.1 hypothetical protein [Erysipelotrichaceae bacterium]